MSEKEETTTPEGYKFTENWPPYAQWSRIIKPFLQGSQGIQMLEIGSFEGRSAIWWLDNLISKHTRSKLHLVDMGFRESQVARLKHNLSLHPQGWQAFYHCGLSREVVPEKFEDEQFDFIYIDGSHEGFETCMDGFNAFYKLKVGGYMLFDDYKWDNPGNKRLVPPGPAIDMFEQMMAPFMECTETYYQKLFRKTKEHAKFRLERGR